MTRCSRSSRRRRWARRARSRASTKRSRSGIGSNIVATSPFPTFCAGSFCSNAIRRAPPLRRKRSDLPSPSPRSRALALGVCGLRFRSPNSTDRPAVPPAKAHAVPRAGARRILDDAGNAGDPRRRRRCLRRSLIATQSKADAGAARAVGEAANQPMARRFCGRRACRAGDAKAAFARAARSRGNNPREPAAARFAVDTAHRLHAFVRGRIRSVARVYEADFVELTCGRPRGDGTTPQELLWPWLMPLEFPLFKADSIAARSMLDGTLSLKPKTKTAQLSVFGIDRTEVRLKLLPIDWHLG